jgi:probable HAF family extracellular repeat protein
MKGLGNLPGGEFNGRALAISADGSVIVGQTHTAPGRAEAFRWCDGVMTGLGTLPDRERDSAALAASGDGTVVVGFSRSSSDSEAFRWEDGKMTGLGDLPGGPFVSTARGVSADGSIVVGEGTSASGEEAFIWSAVAGLRSLRAVLADEFGLDLEGWRLTDARAVSADGRTIVGVGINPDGAQEGWIATLADVQEPSESTPAGP